MTALGLHEIHGFLVTDEEVESMRCWISDCPWADLDDDGIAGLTAAEVVAGVDAHYDGGVRRFLSELNSELEV